MPSFVELIVVDIRRCPWLKIFGIWPTRLLYVRECVRMVGKSYSTWFKRRMTPEDRGHRHPDAYGLWYQGINRDGMINDDEMLFVRFKELSSYNVGS